MKQRIHSNLVSGRGFRIGGIIAAELAGLILAGCTVGTDFPRPAAPDVQGYTPEPPAAPVATPGVGAGEGQRFEPGADIPGQWWTLFRSTELNRLIEEALRANPNLDAAQAALRQARENLYAGEGAIYPTLAVNASGTRERFSGATFGSPGLSKTLSLTTASLTLSYAPDVWGGTRRQIESLQAEAENERFLLEATYLSLTANVVVAAVSMASLDAQIKATEDIIKIETDQLGVVQHQFELGGASKSDVLVQESTLAQTRATLPPLQKQLAQTRNQLMTYLGRLPSQAADERFALADLHLPEDLPLSLPSKLVEQRPDVRSAEAQWHAANASVGVAIANELPQFGITGQLGTIGAELNQMITPGGLVWSLGGSVAQTVVDGGTLLHKKRAADAANDQAAAMWRATVQSAFQDVANALRALQSDAAALQAQAAAERAAAASLDLARTQYKLGAITYLTLLNAQQLYQNALINLVRARAARLSDTAALFQALGGGWWNRADPAPPGDSGSDHFALPPFESVKLPVMAN